MKKKLSIVLAVVLTLTLLVADVTPVSGATNSLPMTYYCGSGENNCWCGPSSGTSIGRYYRVHKGYSSLPFPNSEMYDALYEYMDTDIFGASSPSNYGPGFVEMALHYGYDNFSYVHYGPESDAGPVDEDFYEDIVIPAIDSGWPVALAAQGALSGFSGVEEISTDGNPDKWPCTKRHFIAIKGYDHWYQGHDNVVICTDSYSGADNLYLDWDDIFYYVGEDWLEAVIIKDEDITEDFEWGSDGDPLEPAGGELEWDVYSQGGSSYAEIDDTYSHSGKSAKFYRDGTNYVRGQHPLFRPLEISVYIRKEDTASSYLYIGDGTYFLRTRINGYEKLQYYDGSIWNTVCFVPVDAWFLLEYKDIDWGNGTFDIYVDGVKKKDDAAMEASSSVKGIMRYGNYAGSGGFWIDDISYVKPVIEDFEWGSDGTSLEDWQTYGGEVDWYVITSGASVAEIDTAQKHTGTRSARFYKYNSSSSSAVRAYYSLRQPSYIGFYLKKDGTAYASFKNGDGAKIIDFRINSSEYIQYYSSGWHTYYGYKLPIYSWRLIEVKNINWGAGTYDIYVSGIRRVTATMRSGSIYGGDLWFGIWTGSGTFWIDDIKDSLR